MSLRVWLPLTKDLRNQGLDDVTVTNNGATFNSAGKLGGCYYFNGSAYLYGESISANMKSASLWIKLNNTDAQVVFTDYKSKLGFGIYSNYLVCSCADSTIRTTYPKTLLETNTWIHIAIIRKESLIELYINGDLQTPGTSKDSWTANMSDLFTIGARSNGSTKMTGYMNDFRMYDHYLSPMEVKQLSQGLVLHYPLNRQGFGQENLFSQKYWTYSTSGWAGNVISSVAGSTIKPIINSDGSCILTGAGSSGNSQCYLYNSSHRVNLTANKTYTISVLVTSTNISKFRFWWYDYDSSGNRLTTSVTNIFTINNGETKLLSFTRTLSENTASCYWELNMYTADTSATLLLHAHSLKLEEGSIATPWCPNSSDTLATTMGLNSTIEYDCSGFCNNGERTGTFTWTSDTPKYAVSQDCIGTNYIHLTPPSTKIQTMAVWANWKTIPSGQSVILVDNGSGIGLGLMSTGILCSTSKAGSSYTFSKSNLVANTWYHFVVVKTGTTTRKLYINGVEQTATSNTSNWTFAVNELQLGKRSTTSDGFVGKLSDFRAYATALSASDVLSLYQNCATIDPDGTIRGQIRS